MAPRLLAAGTELEGGTVRRYPNKLCCPPRPPPPEKAHKTAVLRGVGVLTWLRVWGGGGPGGGGMGILLTMHLSPAAQKGRG